MLDDAAAVYRAFKLRMKHLLMLNVCYNRHLDELTYSCLNFKTRTATSTSLFKSLKNPDIRWLKGWSGRFVYSGKYT